jgi:chromosome segregation ATPase
MPGLLLVCGCLAHPWASSPAPNHAVTPSPEMPGQIRQVSLEEPASRQAAEMAQKLNDTRDESKILAARILELQAALDEKTRALETARTEVRHVSDEVSRTRDEIERWRHEVANLRDRAQTAEKENQASLKAMAHLLEMMIEQESTRAAKPAVLPAPAPVAPLPGP